MILIFSFVLISCGYNEHYNEDEREAYVPVYAEDEEKLIVTVENQPLKNPGKIYVYDEYLLVNELYSGVHVINNADSAAPEYVGFIKILGNVDIAVRGNFMYADHMGDLITIDIADIQQPVVTDRQVGLYSTRSVLPPERGYFVCIDRPRKHLIVRWEREIVKNAECYW